MAPSAAAWPPLPPDALPPPGVAVEQPTHPETPATRRATPWHRAIAVFNTSSGAEIFIPQEILGRHFQPFLESGLRSRFPPPDAMALGFPAHGSKNQVHGGLLKIRQVNGDLGQVFATPGPPPWILR